MAAPAGGSEEGQKEREHLLTPRDETYRKATTSIS